MKRFLTRAAPILVVLILAACSLIRGTPEPTEVEGGPTATVENGAPIGVTEIPMTPTATILHYVTPGEGAVAQSSIGDTISGDTAQQGVPNEPPGGDVYLYNLYERPFNALTQDIFFPDLDIRTAVLGLSGDWMYMTLSLYGLDPATNTLARHYGIELDLDIDGRGEWLVMADAPLAEDWTVVGVRAWEDTDGDVGQVYACYADPPQTGDSYDLLYFDEGRGDDPDAAWARFVVGTPPAVQIAFKHSMISYDDKFMWGVWADEGVMQPQWFDYHDHFTKAEAGSPFSAMPEYPIKDIFEVDNTCRMAYGFTEVGNEPCLCAGNVKTPTPTPLIPARLGGYVWKDLLRNGVYDGCPPDGGLGGATVELRAGACPGGALVASTLTGACGRYDFEDIVPGTYCVTPLPIGGLFFEPENISVTLVPGEFRDNVNFMLVLSTIP